MAQFLYSQSRHEERNTVTAKKSMYKGAWEDREDAGKTERMLAATLTHSSRRTKQAGSR